VFQWARRSVRHCDRGSAGPTATSTALRKSSMRVQSMLRTRVAPMDPKKGEVYLMAMCLGHRLLSVEARWTVP